MKKIIAFLMAFALCFSLCACESKDAEPIAEQQENMQGGSVVPETDPIYDQIADMLPCIENFVEYNHILGNSIDYDGVNAEDFWNIVALVVSSYDKAGDISNIDVAGTYHMKWSNMSDIAKTFLYNSWTKHMFPSYRSSYSASADPGSGVIDLIPLDVDNYDTYLERIEIDSDDDNCDYILYIALKGRGEDTYLHHYAVYIADWDSYTKNVYDRVDERCGDHIMPYMVTGYSFISTEDTADELIEENESQN